MSEEKVPIRHEARMWTRPPWHVLTPVQLEMLRGQCKPQSFERHQAIFRQGSSARGLYCLIKGEVLLDQVDKEGNHTAFRIATGGELLGFRSLFAEQPHAAGARAVRRSRICFVPERPLRKALAANALLACEFLKLVATDPGPIYAPLLRNPLLPAASRLAHLLLILQHQYAQDAGDQEVSYDLPLSKSNMAALIGVRRETVSRLLQQFEAAGLCSFRTSRVVIPGAKQLAKFSGTFT